MIAMTTGLFKHTHKKNLELILYIFQIEFKLRSIHCVDVEVPTNCFTFQKKMCQSEREGRLSL